MSNMTRLNWKSTKIVLSSVRLDILNHKIYYTFA